VRRASLVALSFLVLGCAGGDSAGAAQRQERDPIRALIEAGQYEEAERRLRREVEADPGAVELLNRLGEVLVLRGRVGEAEGAFRRAIDGDAPDRLLAELNLAVLRYDRGDHETAMRMFDRFIDVYNRSPSLSAAELTAVGTAVRYLGVRDPQLFKDALRAYEEAIAADPADPEPKLRLGELFLEKYNSQDARELFEEVLATDPANARALLGLARAAHFDGAPDALELAQKSLESNPNLVPARALVARLLLTLERHADAAAEAERALAVNPTSLEALSVLAAARYFQGDNAGFQEAVRRTLELNPRYADLYNTLAEVGVQNRLYREAVEFARRAVALDSTSWRGWGLLGLNQLRIGEIEEGRANLEVAFAGDPYNVWIKNTLDLLDTFGRYREVPTGRFRLVLAEREADLLAPYLTELAEQAYDALAERYGHRPATPIRVELFPNHADFSVRTVGLAGLGALGVSFGPVIAMDSPSAQDRGSFNWGSTFWHELAHTVHLEMTDHRVPRWLTEGLAVLEERRARPGWGAGPSAAFLVAYREGRMPPASRLNDGFVRPQYPAQIGFSYYMASLVCEMIEERYGFRVILDILAGYRHGLSTEQVLDRVLGLDPDGFDRAFDAYLQARFAGPLAALSGAGPDAEGRPASTDELVSRARHAPNDYMAQLAAGRMLVREGRYEEALPFLERAAELFPEYGGHDGPYPLLAEAHRRLGDTRRAAEALERLTRLEDSHYEANLELAGLLESLGDAAGAAAALERAIYVYPFDAALHERLAALYAGLGEWRKVVRERQAILALDPVDRAEALYQLALAQLKAGDAAAARRTVLQALERAPNFGKAQELLLRIRSTSGSGAAETRDSGESGDSSGVARPAAGALSGIVEPIAVAGLARGGLGPTHGSGDFVPGEVPLARPGGAP